MIKKSIAVVLIISIVMSISSIAPFSVSAVEINSSVSETANSSELPPNKEHANEFEANIEFVSEEEQETSMDEIKAEETEPPIKTVKKKIDLEPVGDGTFTVNGFTYDVANRQATITAYNNNSVSEITIPNKLGGYLVTAIGDSVFKNFNNLTTVTIPNSVITIGAECFENTPWYNNQTDGLVYAGRTAYKFKGSMSSNTVIALKDNTVSVSPYAFQNCANLKQVVFNDGIEVIGDYAFDNCTILEEASLPDSVTTIGACAFKGDVSLWDLKFSANLTTIGDYAFQDCTALFNVTVPKGVTSAHYAFYGCENIETMVFEEGTKAIPEYIAYNCRYLTDISIPDGVTAIGKEAFSSCANLAEITLPKSLTTVDGYTSWNTAYGPFTYCQNLKKIIFEDGIITIPNYIAANCTGLEEVVIPDSVTCIEAYAFCGDSSLNNVRLPKYLTKLYNDAFGRCSTLTEITIPKTLTEVNYAPFSECTSLKKMTFENGATVIPTYIAYTCTALETVIIPDSVTDIGDNAFSGDTGLCRLTLPKNLTALGRDVFQNTGLTEITIPKTLTTVDGYTSWNTAYGPFTYCQNLKKIIFEDGIITIPNYIAANCTGLEEVVIPDSVTCIEAYAFCGDSSLNNVRLPKYLTKLYNDAFGRCSTLTEITIPKTLTEVNYAPFSECTSLKKMTFENGATVIPTYIAYTCTALETVIIPDSVTDIGDNAFSGDTGLCRLTLPKNLTALGRDVFQNTGLTEITIPKTLTTVDGYTSWNTAYGPFTYCHNLKKMIFEDGIITIPNYIAATCTGLEEVVIPDSVTCIEEYAFYGCNCLKSIFLSENIDAVEYTALDNCPNLIIYCDKYSKVVIELIDRNTDVITYNETRSIPSAVIDDGKSYYEARNTTGTSFVCNYSIKTSLFSAISNPYVKIKIPMGAEISEQSLYVDGVLCTDYEDNNDYITIPVKVRQGKVAFNLSFTGESKVVTYATLNYDWNGSSNYDIIDIINNDIPVIAVYSDEITSSETVHVTGMAPVSTEVRLAVDNTNISTVHSNKAGFFSTDIRIPSPENDKVYSISASAEYFGKTIKNETKIKYRENAPELISFTMDYKDITYDLMSGNNYSISFVPSDSYPFHFSVKFANYESVGSVCITSTRNQNRKSVDAKWDEKTKSFVFDGFFDESNYSYVPGKISVVFYLKNEYLTDNTELLESIRENTRVTEIVNTDNKYEASLDFGNGQTWTYTHQTSLSVEQLCKELGVDYSPETSSKDESVGASEFITDSDYVFDIIKEFEKDVSKDVIVQGSTETDGFAALINDHEDESFIYICENASRKAFEKTTVKYGGGLFLSEAFNGLSFSDGKTIAGSVYGIGKAIVTYRDKVYDIESVVNNIQASNLPQSEKDRRMKDVNAVGWGYTGLAALSIAGTVATAAATVALGPFGGLVAGFAISVFTSIIENNLDSTLDGYNVPSDSNMNFLVDPSGYVYAAVTTNRIPGAKVTTYWIPYDDEDDSFWDNPDESKSQVWLADEYSQVNPLFTDANGDYAWDVPEGWWQVVVEKDGYETYTSEWLPVPPPQTEVNINLLSKAIPQITNATVDGSTITLVFSEYMNPETLDGIIVNDDKGHDIPFALTYSNNETNIDGTVYAKEYYLEISESSILPTDYYTVNIEHAKSYSNVDYMGELKINAVQYQIGDTDLDGNITISDVTEIQKYLAESIILTNVQLSLADTNGDGVVDINDATHLQKYLAEFEGIVLGKQNA